MDTATQKKRESAFREGLRHFDSKRSWTCPWSEIAHYPITPDSIVNDDIWIIPMEWAPPHGRQLSFRKIDFSKAVVGILTDEDAEAIKRRLKRLAVLDRFQTLRAGRKSIPPATPITWVKKYCGLIKAVRYVLENKVLNEVKSECPDGFQIFANLSESDLLDVKRACPAWANSNIPRYNALFNAGLFDDWPAGDVSPFDFKPREGSRVSDPFSDTAFAAIVKSALWLNSIQDSVLEAYLEIKDVETTSSGARRSALVQEYRRELVQNWEGDGLTLGLQFPFWFETSGRRMQIKRYEKWPLDTVLSLRTLLQRCQTANAILILSATGMRIGELASLSRTSLSMKGNRWYLTANTYKDTDLLGGEEREWPLPKVAASAYSAQLRLSKFLGHGSDFWFTGTKPKHDYSVLSLDGALRHYGDTTGPVGGDSLANIDGRLSAHRFRFSVSRLVSLSLTGASQVLFDVLGHDDIEVTLGYAQRDPELAEDINRIRAEVKAIRIETVFNRDSQNGGRAAALVSRCKTELLARLGKEVLETDDIGEAASILGEAEVVKPGVLCTAQPFERGACSSPLGIRDHGTCSPVCSHRLETAVSKQDRALKLGYLLEKAENAEGLNKVFFLNQIMANLHAFPALFREFGADQRLHKAVSNNNLEFDDSVSTEFLDAYKAFSGSNSV